MGESFHKLQNKDKLLNAIAIESMKEMEAWTADTYWLPCRSIFYTEQESTVVAHIWMCLGIYQGNSSAISIK